MRKNSIVYLILIAWLTSCGVSTEFESVSDVEGNIWLADSSMSFDFNIKKDGNYDVYYIVKNKTTYPYYNLYFKVDFRDQNSLLSDKLQEVILFDKKTGKPYGKGLGGVMEHEFLAFKKQPLKKGQHTLNIKQYMRVNQLRDIMAIGVKVAKAE